MRLITGLSIKSYYIILSLVVDTLNEHSLVSISEAIYKMQGRVIFFHRQIRCFYTNAYVICKIGYIVNKEKKLYKKPKKE